jgi:cysteine desulfurase
VALGTAAHILTSKTKYRQIRWKKNASHMESMRKKLLQNLVSALGESIVRPNGPTDPSKRLPNTLSVGLKDVQSGDLLKAIQMTVACSAGSACHSSGGKLSPVLEAMNVPLEFARGTLRISVGPDTTQDDIDAASKVIIEEVKRQLEM